MPKKILKKGDTLKANNVRTVRPPKKAKLIETGEVINSEGKRTGVYKKKEKVKQTKKGTRTKTVFKVQDDSNNGGYKRRRRIRTRTTTPNS